MILASRVDLVRPINLLQEHDPGQMVGEGHGGHGQLHCRQILDRRMQPERTADETIFILGGNKDLQKFLNL